MYRHWIRAVVCGAAIALLSSGAQAFEAFVKKEGKPCGFCHVNPAGGGKRNYRGIYYKMHNLTFAEFDDAAEAKAAGSEVAPDPDPKVKPTSWTAPKKAEPAAPPVAPPVEAPKGPSVAELRKRAAAAESMCKAKPKDAKCKQAYSKALGELGHALMTDRTAGPPVKRYPEALSLLRKAVALDPANKAAAEDIKMIEDAYKSMGKPIPK